jgi:acyl dehydratase
MDSVLSMAGRRGRTFQMLVEAGKAREFAAAVTPDSAGGLGSDPGLTPVTFLASARFWCPPESSAWHGVERDYRRVLHGGQEFTFAAGPVPTGITLEGVEEIERTYARTGSAGPMAFTETVTAFHDVASGAEVAAMRSTSITLERHTPPTRDNSPRVPWTPPDTHVQRYEFVDDALSLTRFVRYQGASGDFNPIHHDADFAVAAGYPSPIAVGMLTAGIAAALLTSRIDVKTLRRYRTRWHAPAWPGDRLRYQLFQDAANGRSVTIVASRASGQTHMVANAEIASGTTPW